MNRNHTLLALLFLAVAAVSLPAAPFAVSAGISGVYPSPGENVLRDNLLAVDAHGDHHFVSLTGSSSGVEV